MRQRKIIKVRNPLLRTLRNNLRRILIKASAQEDKRLSREFAKIHWEGGIMTSENARDISRLTQSERDRSQELQHKKALLSKETYSSVCICRVCNDSKSDMTYIPWMKAWICVNCANSGHYDKPTPEN